MASAQTAEITRLLRAWTHGDQEALKRITPLVYDELHRMAQGLMTRKPGQMNGKS